MAAANYFWAGILNIWWLDAVLAETISKTAIFVLTSAQVNALTESEKSRTATDTRKPILQVNKGSENESKEVLDGVTDKICS